MDRKNKKNIQLLVFCMIFVMLITTFAATQSDNDGSSFITKAEFDSVKNSFQSQIDSYMSRIDSKIDEAISNYLAGIVAVTNVYPSSEINKVKNQSVLGTEYKFGKTWDTFTFKQPSGIWSGFIFNGWGRGDGVSGGGWQGATMMGNYDSMWRGRVIEIPANASHFTNWEAYEPLICFETEKITVGNDIVYRKLYSKNLYDVKYLYSGNQTYYAWKTGFNPSVLAADSWSFTLTNNLYTAMDSTTHLLKWVDCTMNQTITVNNSTRKAFSNNGTQSNDFSFNCSFTSKFNKTFTVKQNLGYCVDTLGQDMRYLDADQWDVAWWDDGTDTTHTHIGTSGYLDLPSYPEVQISNNTQRVSAQGLTSTHYKIPVYIHKSEKMNVDELINEPAMKSQYDTTQPVRFYNGLPLCYCTADGVLTIKLKSKATKVDTGADDNAATWTGKLYLSDSKFNKNTTQSHVVDENGNNFTGNWTFNNTNKDQTIKIMVKRGDEIWLKYNIDTITAGDLIEFSTDTDNGLMITSSQ